jgi:hypothetical protein
LDNFIGAPLNALSSASVTLVGKAVITGGAVRGGGTVRFGEFGFVATLGGAAGFVRRSSLELQLEIPKAATNESTRTVNATRAGVHNGFPVLA